MGIDHLDRGSHVGRRCKMMLKHAKLPGARARVLWKWNPQIQRTLVTAFHSRTGRAILLACILVVPQLFRDALNRSDIAALRRLECQLLQLCTGSPAGFA